MFDVTCFKSSFNQSYIMIMVDHWKQETFDMQISSFIQIEMGSYDLLLVFIHSPFIKCKTYSCPLPRPFQRSHPIPSPCVTLRNRFFMVRSWPTPILEDHSLSAVSDCLFSTFVVTLHVWRLILHLQPEDLPCHGDRNPHKHGLNILNKIDALHCSYQ